MMGHGLKLTSLLIALAFQGMVVVDATGLHGCPRHDALPGEVSEAPADHEHVGHGQDALIDASDAAHGESHEGVCTCIGNCHVGGESQVALAASPPTLPSVPAAPDLAPAARTAERLPGVPPYLLPYSQAPPTTA